MGKIVRWSKMRGWKVGLTPYQYHVYGSLLFAFYRFAGARKPWNKRRKPVS